MFFILGFLTGLLFALFFITSILFFKEPIEKMVAIYSKQISNKKIKGKGAIIDSGDEYDDVRKEKIEENRRQGRDTNINELL